MNERTKTGIQIIQVAIVIGLLGDLLLRAMPWGLNVLLFNLAFVCGTIYLLRRRAVEQLTLQTLALFGAQIFFSAMFVLRDSPQLRVADSFAILAALSVLFLSRMNVKARLAGIIHYIGAFLWASLHALTAPFALVFNDIEWPSVPREGWRKHLFSIFRGVLIATPLIFIFGALFVAADAAFEGIVQRIFDFKPEIIVTHVLLFGVFAWMSAGYLRGVLIDPFGFAASGDLRVTPDVPETPSPEPVDDRPVDLGDHTAVEHLNISDPPQAETTPSAAAAQTADKKPWNWANIDNTMLPSSFTLGTIEVAIILGLMNLLFLSFVIVQVPYLFGGMDLVQNTPDFKLAEYARRGFGELVAVSALVLPTLLFGHWLIRRESSTAHRLFRILAGTQIILLFVIMASAVQRLILLTGNVGYGLTTVRLYPLIFMSWLAIVFVWFAVTVLRGARQYFAWGALWTAFAVLGAAHMLNPDSLIVSTNFALLREGRDFDDSYNYNYLSADAIPALVTGLDQLDGESRCRAKIALHNTYRQLGEEGDVRSLNWSRRTAWNVLHQNDAMIHDVSSCPDWVKENLDLSRQNP